MGVLLPWRLQPGSRPYAARAETSRIHRRPFDARVTGDGKVMLDPALTHPNVACLVHVPVNVGVANETHEPYRYDSPDISIRNCGFDPNGLLPRHYRAETLGFFQVRKDDFGSGQCLDIRQGSPRFQERWAVPGVSDGDQDVVDVVFDGASLFGVDDPWPFGKDQCFFGNLCAPNGGFRNSFRRLDTGLRIGASGFGNCLLQFNPRNACFGSVGSSIGGLLCQFVQSIHYGDLPDDESAGDRANDKRTQRGQYGPCIWARFAFCLSGVIAFFVGFPKNFQRGLNGSRRSRCVALLIGCWFFAGLLLWATTAFPWSWGWLL